MADCRQCADFDWCAEHEDCGLFTLKPQTNADRIRAMTDEELAVWIAETANCSDWCILNEQCKSRPDNETCPNVWFNWLKKESERRE